jgi:cobalamin biosynthesis protein CobW
MAAKIPVTVITGFLGSGKTTLIRNLLQNNGDRRIAVLVNEFGELGIDGELLRACEVCPDDTPGTPETAAIASNIVELTNGCLCCTVQEEFLPTMLELLKRRDSLDHILIETSGLALPKPLIKAFRWPEIRNAATVDGVVTVVDCAAVAAGTFASDPDAVEGQRQADENLDHETPLQELFEDQLACADLVILNKTDLVAPDGQALVIEQIRQELPRAVKIVSSVQSRVQAEPGLDAALLLGLGSAVEADLENRPSHHDHLGDDHDHDDEMTSTHVVLDRSFDPAQLQACLEALVIVQDIYRIKGFVSVPNKPMRLVLQGVGQRFDSFYDRPWQLDEPRQTRLVFIGHGLDQSAIATALRQVAIH